MGTSNLNTHTKMARGPKKHLKRIRTPKSWMLDKLTGVYAPRPMQGPHRLREYRPLPISLRNRLTYALNGNECRRILNDKDNEVKVDGKVRRNAKYPVGFMDVLSIPKTGENYRMLYDVKGRFSMVKVKQAEAGFKLCKVKRRFMGQNKIPYIVTHDARTIRFTNPAININDSVKIDLESNTIAETLPIDLGANVFVTGGNNRGRVGVITNRTVVNGGYDMIAVKDKNGHSFNTRVGNCFVIGKGAHSMTTLPRHAGVKRTIIEEYDDKHFN